MVISQWFPRTGRGLLIGLWASNATLGDVIGAQIYKLTSGTSADENWGVGFFISGAFVFIVGLMNYFLLIEDPQDIGIVIEESVTLVQSKKQQHE